ncbi:MAG: histidine phosphatase family protein [Thermomicrobiales bacterium]
MSIYDGLPTIHSSLRHPTNGETTLYLVRHGRTMSNVSLLLHGRTNVPLDSLGVRQAHLVAERIADEVGSVDALLSSPLARALTTARIIGDRVGIEPEIVPGLIEMDFGLLEGVTIEVIQRDHADIALSMADPDNLDAGWPEGESRVGFHSRVLATFQSMLSEYATHSVVVVAHGGVIGSFLAQVQGLSPNNLVAYDLSNCGLTHLTITPDHTAVHLLNDVLHLDVLSGRRGRRLIV